MRIALMAGAFDDGGVERTLTNLAAGLSRLGVVVDVLAGKPDHAYVQGLPSGVGVTPLTGAEGALAAYLTAARPDLIMTGKLADDRAALAARESLGSDLLVVATVGTPLSVSVAGKRFNPWRVFRETRRIRADYRRLDGITAVSEAVAADLRRHFGVSEVPLRVLCNPIVPDDLQARAAMPCPHPWLAPGAPPVVVAVGGLRKVKDFTTLLRAFACLSAQSDARLPDARLLVLGEGKERNALTRLARQLGIDARVELHGFVDDPFPYLARARALVLSSRREGLSNVLVEAMALGTPVAATDCPGGVRDLLAQGTLGPLTPVGDADALAVSINRLLLTPTEPAALMRAAEPYGVMAASRHYLAFFEALVAGRDR